MADIEYEWQELDDAIPLNEGDDVFLFPLGASERADKANAIIVTNVSGQRGIETYAREAGVYMVGAEDVLIKTVGDLEAVREDGRFFIEYELQIDGLDSPEAFVDRDVVKALMQQHPKVVTSWPAPNKIRMFGQERHIHLIRASLQMLAQAGYPVEDHPDTLENA